MLYKRYNGLYSLYGKLVLQLTSRLMLLESVCAVHSAAFRFYTEPSHPGDVTSRHPLLLGSILHEGLVTAAIVTGGMKVWLTSFSHILFIIDIVSTMKDNIIRERKTDG